MHQEYHTIEPNILITHSAAENMPEVISQKDTKKILNTLCSVNNGVFRMSPDIAGLVETSSSLARVLIENKEFITQSLQRSSVESTKDEIAMTIRCTFENMGCVVSQTGDFQLEPIRIRTS